jgi:SAM-dependent methyltransferase
VEPFGRAGYRIAFERFRALPQAAFERYYECLNMSATSTGRLLDIGAGPGIQAEMLLRTLPVQWGVDALEPSRQLADAARVRLAQFGARASVKESTFDAFPASRKYHAVWASEVTHLLGDPSSWVEKAARCTRPGGRVVIRTSTHEQLRDRHWYRHFPSALAVDLARHPARSDVVRALERAGFSEVHAVSVDESRPMAVTYLLESFESKAFSTLHLIDERDLADGILSLRNELKGARVTKWHYEMTAYVGTRCDEVSGA